ncbi:hypothetical protein C0J52_15732 [Blattella germanica]|nr:hypothetical protein C0J52_15732 [Blattella germanica]
MGPDLKTSSHSVNMVQTRKCPFGTKLHIRSGLKFYIKARVYSFVNRQFQLLRFTTKHKEFSRRLLFP